jgi:hypothetical protein
LKGLHELCEFENEHLLPFIDILYVDLKDGGYLASVLLEYESELVEQPLLLTHLASCREQQPMLVCGISVFHQPELAQNSSAFFETYVCRQSKC